MTWVARLRNPQTLQVLGELRHSGFLHLTPQNQKSGWAALAVLLRQGFGPHATLIVIDIGLDGEILGMTQIMPCLPLQAEHMAIGYFPRGIQNSAHVTGYPGELRESATSTTSNPVQWNDLAETAQHGADVFVVLCEKGIYFSVSFRANGHGEIQSASEYVNPGPLEQMADKLRLKFWHDLMQYPGLMAYISWVFGKDTTLLFQHRPGNNDGHSDPRCTACYNANQACSVHTCPDCANNCCRDGFNLRGLRHIVSSANPHHTTPQFDSSWIDRICQNRQLPMRLAVISVWLQLLLMQAGPSTPSSPVLPFSTSALEEEGDLSEEGAEGAGDLSEEQAGDGGREDQGEGSRREDRRGDSGQHGPTEDVQSELQVAREISAHHVVSLSKNARIKKSGNFTYFTGGVPLGKPVFRRDTRVRVFGDAVKEDDYLEDPDKLEHLSLHRETQLSQHSNSHEAGVSRIGTVVSGHDLSFELINKQEEGPLETDPGTGHVCEYILERVGEKCYELVLYAVQCTGDEEPGLYLADQLEVCEGALGGFPGGARQDPQVTQVTQVRAIENGDGARATEEGGCQPPMGRVKRMPTVVDSSDDDRQSEQNQGNPEKKKTKRATACKNCGMAGHNSRTCHSYPVNGKSQREKRRERRAPLGE